MQNKCCYARRCAAYHNTAYSCNNNPCECGMFKTGKIVRKKG